MSKLACFVYVSDQAGTMHAFGPNDYVPEWACEKITNPHVWDVAPEVPAEVSWQPATTVVVGTGGEGGGAEDDGPPPQGGAGASRQKWADYATTNGVTVEASWKREDIIAACEDAGILV